MIVVDSNVLAYLSLPGVRTPTIEDQLPSSPTSRASFFADANFQTSRARGSCALALILSRRDLRF